jgi:hypothetical protein
MPSLATILTLTKATLPSALITVSLQTNALAASNGVSTIGTIGTANAIAGGVAQWFAMYHGNLEAIVVGDITTVTDGTGAIQLNDTTIVQGRSYQFQNISVTMPTTFTY